MEKVAATLEQHKYQLMSQIGQGATAHCYIVTSLKYNLPFVCKAINTFIKKTSKTKIEFADEIELLCNITHKNIIQIYDHFEDDQYLYLILEYCQRGSIGDILQSSGPIPKEELRQFIQQGLSALSYCHAQNISHHDIKPSNFLVDSFGRLKLADFGLAHTYNLSQSSDVFVGSLAYLAPEVFRKHPYDPFKADVWSFGVSVYHMATGKLPFASSCLSSLREKITMGTYPMLNMPSFAKRIVTKCLHLDPESRPTFYELAALYGKTEKEKKMTSVIIQSHNQTRMHSRRLQAQTYSSCKSLPKLTRQAILPPLRSPVCRYCPFSSNRESLREGN